MSFAAAPGWVADAGLICGAGIAFIGFVKAVTGWAPIRFAVRRLVHDPATERFEAVIEAKVTPMLAAALAELRPNHGSSTRDAVDRIERHVTALDRRTDVIERTLDEHLKSGGGT